MSSTTNVQNLLSNVFRPTFVYNVVAGNYQTKLELVNIDTVSANTVSTYAVMVDLSSNSYIGGGAGNPNSTLAASGNFRNTFVGTGAGTSSQNVSNGVLVGYLAASAGGGVGSISIGANTLNGGSSNIYIGYGTGISAGNNNIFIGPGIANSGTLPSNTSNTLVIGNGGTPTIIGDLTGHRVGFNMSSLPATDLPLTLDVNGYARIQNGYLGINTVPGDYTLDVNGNMQVSDGYGVLTFTRDGPETTTPGVSRTSLTGIVNATGALPSVGIATLQVSDGYFSATGATTGSTTTIPLKKGMFMVSAISNLTVHGYVGISYDSSNQTVVSSNAGGGLITSNAGNVTIATNTTWTVTYFPSP